MFHLDKDQITQVREILDQISVIDKGYFAKDKQKNIKAMMEECIKILDKNPIDLIQNKKEKAEMLYLRGKTLDFNPEYSKLAEENLSKSIKLMPTKKEAWDALGHVYWKKNDLH